MLLKTYTSKTNTNTPTNNHPRTPEKNTITSHTVRKINQNTRTHTKPNPHKYSHTQKKIPKN